MSTKSCADASKTRNAVTNISPSPYPPRDIRVLSFFIPPFTLVSIIVSPAHLAYGLLRSFPQPLTSKAMTPQSQEPLPLLFWITFVVCVVAVGAICFAGLWCLWLTLPRRFVVSDRWDPSRVTLYEMTVCYSLLFLGFVWVAFSTSLPFLIFLIAYWALR